MTDLEMATDDANTEASLHANDDQSEWSGARMAERGQVGTAPLEHLRASGMPGKVADLDSILDIPITLSVEIGKSKLSIRHLLQLNQGAVVELDRIAGEPLDVLVNGTLVAHGEVVVVNEKLGIRLTDVVSAQERVKKLK
jgi:flagellar motor switch protein FliN